MTTPHGSTATGGQLIFTDGISLGAGDLPIRRQGAAVFKLGKPMSDRRYGLTTCRRLAVFYVDVIAQLKRYHMKMRSRLLLAPIAAMAILSSNVWAHAHLKAASPADKASVSSPSELDLTFSEALTLKFSGATLTGPDQKEVNLGDAMLMDGGKMLMIGVPGKLAPGAYKVNWRALSVDGHKTSGTYTFTVKP
ncbi:copper homeostasis periplasmic binding protein CopC [Pandoraea soli]|nr:copper homeostasis periplasmic binding protein CopC [Pandoraea soli]